MFTLKQEISDGVRRYLTHWAANLDPVFSPLLNAYAPDCRDSQKKIYMKWLYITVNISVIKWILSRSSATAMRQASFSMRFLFDEKYSS
jgi:hypothetical protein